MNQIAKNLGDADIKALAAYYASQPPPQPAAAVAQKPPMGAPSERTHPGTAMREREGIGVTGGEPSGSQGPGGAGSK